MSGKVSILTGTFGEPGSAWKRLYDLTMATKLKYVAIQGGLVDLNMHGEAAWNHYLYDENGHRKWNHPSFARTRRCEDEVGYLLAHPDLGIEFVLWIDADAAFTRYDVDLCEYLNSVNPTAAFYCANDHNGINTGVMAFRVCAASLELLTRVWNADPSYDTGRWWEQGALSDISKEMGIDAYPEKAFFDAYPQEPIRWDCPDFIPGYSFIVHAPAKSDEERHESLLRCIEESRDL